MSTTARITRTSSNTSGSVLPDSPIGSQKENEEPTNTQLSTSNTRPIRSVVTGQSIKSNSNKMVQGKLTAFITNKTESKATEDEDEREVERLTRKQREHPTDPTIDSLTSTTHTGRMARACKNITNTANNTNNKSATTNTKTKATKQPTKANKKMKTSNNSSSPTSPTTATDSDSTHTHSNSWQHDHNHATTDANSASPISDSGEVEARGDLYHCGVCEGRGLLLLCDGPCGRGFHADCMPERPDTAEGESWFCNECFNKEHECFECHQLGIDDEEVFLCKAKKCGKFYHKDCIRTNKRCGAFNSTGFLCPRHRCKMCNQTAGNGKGGFYMCLRCIDSYHGKYCMPNAQVYKFKDGNVILCNTDRETLNATTDRSNEDTVEEEGEEEDEELELEIAKHTPETNVPVLAPFNPFAIIQPDQVIPTDATMTAANTNEIASTTPSTSPAAAAASYTTNQLSPSSSMSDIPSLTDISVASSSSTTSTSTTPTIPSDSSLPRSLHFPSALWSPPGEIAEFRLPRSVIKEGEAYVPKPKLLKAIPPYFKRVSANQYGIYVNKPSYKVDTEVCMCSEQNDKCEENCINRAMYQECTRKCPNGDECKNQRIARHQYAKTAVVLTENRGFGLISKEDIPAGSLIIEYCGEMITDEECTRRLNETEITGNKEYYFFKVDDDLVIDAGPIGNNARFLNHSCSPNCKTELWQIGCQKRVGIFTLVDVPKNTELTYDYNFEGFWQPGAALKCHCGAPNCAGTLGGKKKTQKEMAELNAKSSSKKGGADGKKKTQAKRKPPAKSSSTTASSAELEEPPTKRRAPPKERVAAAAASSTSETDSDMDMDDLNQDHVPDLDVEMDE